MSKEPHDLPWPAEAGDVDDLPREMAPPPDHEDRVTQALLRRGLIARDGRAATHVTGWAKAAVAAFVLLGAGYLAGRLTAPAPAPVPEQLQYALLLYETEGYERAAGAEALERYREYSVWVAEALARGQFVDGKDLDVDRGWILSPAGDGPTIELGAPIASDAPLSGLFLITADDPDQALALAESLPHVRHGGRVVVQKVLRTDVPPGVHEP